MSINVRLQSMLGCALSLTRWVLARAAYCIVILFGAVFVTNKLVAGSIFMTSADALQFGAIEQDRVWALLLVCTTLFAALLYRPFFSWVDRRPADELAFTRKTVPEFAHGTLLAALMFALPVLILAARGSISATLPTPHRVLMVLTLAAHAAVTEEIMFRGFLLQFLLKFCHPILATLLVAAMFMAAHVPDGRDSIGLASVFLGSMAMTVAYFMTRSLWLPIGLHFGWDLIIFVLNEQPGSSRFGALPAGYFQIPLYAAQILVLVAMIGVVTYRAMNPATATTASETGT